MLLFFLLPISVHSDSSFSSSFTTTGSETTVSLNDVCPDVNIDDNASRLST